MAVFHLINNYIFCHDNEISYLLISETRYGESLNIIHQQMHESYSFIHSVFCLTIWPKPPPKRFLHIVRSRASSFKWEYPLLSLRSSSSFLRLLPHLLFTSISPFIFPSIICIRRQFLRKMWPIQLAFRFLISCRIRIVLYIILKLFTLKHFHYSYMFR
jgi:hypothetical protein